MTAILNTMKIDQAMFYYFPNRDTDFSLGSSPRDMEYPPTISPTGMHNSLLNIELYFYVRG